MSVRRLSLTSWRQQGVDGCVVTTMTAHPRKDLSLLRSLTKRDRCRRGMTATQAHLQKEIGIQLIEFFSFIVQVTATNGEWV